MTVEGSGASERGLLLIPTRFAAVLVLAVLSVPPGRADSWPEFRGPTGQGVGPQAPLPTEWGTTKNVAWKQRIPGTGWSSPVVQDGRVYLTTAVPARGGGARDLSLRALALDAATGRVLWDTEVIREDGSKAPSIHGKNSHASPTPIVAGNRLYVHFGHLGRACLDLGGRVLWRNTELGYDPVHGNGGSPVLVDDALVFSADGDDRQFVAALDRNTGRLLWKTDRETSAAKKFSFSTPLVITVKGQKQVVSPGSGAVCAYDPRTGREIWRVRYGQGYSVVPRPVYGHGLVFVCTGFDSSLLLAIRPGGKGDVTDTHVAWRLRGNMPHTPSPLLVGDDLYTVSDGGIASCLDARTGRVLWQQRLGGSYSASPLAAGGKVYFQSEEGTGVVVRASRRFERVARNALDEPTLASCAAADGALFIRTERHLYRIQGR
jgi:outer membrane protein assembly factor BamB